MRDYRVRGRLLTLPGGAVPRAAGSAPHAAQEFSASVALTSYSAPGISARHDRGWHLAFGGRLWNFMDLTFEDWAHQES